MRNSSFKALENCMSCSKYLETNIFVSLHWARPFTGRFLTLAFIMLYCWLLSWGGRCTADPGHTTLSSPSWGSSCSCSEVAVKGKKCKVNTVGCTNSDLCTGCSHMHMMMRTGENLSKDLFLSKLFCYWVVSTCCAHPFPKAIESMVQTAEGMGLNWELLSGVPVCCARPRVCWVRQG